MAVLVERDNYVVEHTDDGIYFVTLRGDFTPATVEAYRADALPLMEQLAPLLHLTDVTDVGDGSLSARWALARHVKSQAHLIKRSAVYGVSPTMRLLIGAVLRGAGRRDIKVARDRAEAEAYLLEK